MFCSASRPLAVSIRMRTAARSGSARTASSNGKAVELGHHHIEHHQVRAMGSDGRQTLLAVARHADLEALALHQKFQRDDDVGLVVDDQDAFGHGCGSPSGLRVGSPDWAGSSKQRVAPFSGRLSAQMRPPRFSTIWRLMGRPSPVPTGLSPAAARSGGTSRRPAPGRSRGCRSRCRSHRPASRSPSAARRISTSPVPAGRTWRRSTAGSPAPAPFGRGRPRRWPTRRASSRISLRAAALLGDQLPGGRHRLLDDLLRGPPPRCANRRGRTRSWPGPAPG